MLETFAGSLGRTSDWLELLTHLRLCSAQGSDVQKDRQVFQDWTSRLKHQAKTKLQNVRFNFVLWLFCWLAEEVICDFDCEFIYYHHGACMINGYLYIMCKVKDDYGHPRHRTTVARLLPLCRSSVHGEPIGIPLETVESAKDWQADLIVISDISLLPLDFGY